MTSSVSGVVNYTYNAGDRLLTAGPLTFAWDDNGNMTGKGSAVYTFDALNRLTQVVSGTTTVQFGYNGDGVRVRKAANGTGTDYVQEVAAPLPVVVVETTAGQADRYVYSNNLLARVDPAGDLAFYHADGLGSTRALSNLAGQRTVAYSYDVFGELRSHVGSGTQPFTFTGEQLDDDIGLVYLRARYYVPSIGRFLSRDSFPGYEKMTQSVNRFIYVQNHPTGRVDPSGHDAIGDARQFIFELGAQVQAIPEFISSGAYRYVDVTDREFWSGAARGMDDAVNFIRTPSRIIEEKAQSATGLERAAHEVGGLVWYGFPPISIPAAFFSSISGDIKLSQGTMSTRDFVGLQVECVSSLLFDYFGGLAHKVPGRNPNFGTKPQVWQQRAPGQAGGRPDSGGAA